MTDHKTFEATYPAYPFPILVDVAVALGRLFVRSGKPSAASQVEAPLQATPAR